jgi:hypothetical protein
MRQKSLFRENINLFIKYKLSKKSNHSQYSEYFILEQNKLNKSEDYKD